MIISEQKIKQYIRHLFIISICSGDCPLAEFTGTKGCLRSPCVLDGITAVNLKKNNQNAVINTNLKRQDIPFHFLRKWIPGMGSILNKFFRRTLCFITALDSNTQTLASRIKIMRDGRSSKGWNVLVFTFGKILITI